MSTPQLVRKICKKSQFTLSIGATRCCLGKYSGIVWGLQIWGHPEYTSSLRIGTSHGGLRNFRSDKLRISPNPSENSVLGRYLVVPVDGVNWNFSQYFPCTSWEHLREVREVALCVKTLLYTQGLPSHILPTLPPPRTWNLDTYSSCYWHLVVIIGDLLKLVHLRHYPPPTGIDT